MHERRESCPRCGWRVGPRDRHCSLCGLAQRGLELTPDILLLAAPAADSPVEEGIAGEMLARSLGPQELRVFPLDVPEGLAVELDPPPVDQGLSLPPGAELRLRVTRARDFSGPDPVLTIATTAGPFLLRLRTSPLPPLSIEPLEIQATRGTTEEIRVRLRLARGSETFRLGVEGAGLELLGPPAGEPVHLHGGTPRELVLRVEADAALAASGLRLTVLLGGGGRMSLPLHVVERRPPQLVVVRGKKFPDARVFPGDVAEVEVELANAGMTPYPVERVELLTGEKKRFDEAGVVELGLVVGTRLATPPFQVAPKERLTLAARCSGGDLNRVLDLTVRIAGSGAADLEIPLRIDAREPTEHHYAPVSFDFGTSVSTIATRHRKGGGTGRAVTLPLRDRTDDFLPSDVRLRVGARGELVMEPDWATHLGSGASASDLGVATNIKRRLGHRSVEEAVETVVIDGRRVDVPIEDLAAFVVGEMKREAERFLDARISEVVATHPTRFSLRRIEALRRVYERAGFPNVRLMDEATAAGIVGMLARRVEKDRYRMLVYDMGGGTTDVTLFEVENREIPTGIEIRPRVLDVTGHPRLGGRDVTEAMYRSFVERLTAADRARFPLPESDELDPLYQQVAGRNRLKLFADLDRFKVAMFSRPGGEDGAGSQGSSAGELGHFEAQIWALGGEEPGHVDYVTFDAEQIQQPITADLARFWDELDELLDLNRIDDLEMLYFAGRSSRLPIVSQGLTERLSARYPRLGTYWAHDPKHRVTLKSAVAIGACLAQDLRTGTGDVLVLENLDDRSASRFGYRGSRGEFVEMLGRAEKMGEPSQPRTLPIRPAFRSDLYELRLEIVENPTLDAMVDGNPEAEQVGVARISFTVAEHDPEASVDVQLVLDQDRRLHVIAELQGRRQTFAVET